MNNKVEKYEPEYSEFIKLLSATSSTSHVEVTVELAVTGHGSVTIHPEAAMVKGRVYADEADESDVFSKRRIFKEIIVSSVHVPTSRLEHTPITLHTSNDEKVKVSLSKIVGFKSPGGATKNPLYNFKKFNGVTIDSKKELVSEALGKWPTEVSLYVSNDGVGEDCRRLVKHCMFNAALGTLMYEDPAVAVKAVVGTYAAGVLKSNQVTDEVLGVSNVTKVTESSYGKMLAPKGHVSHLFEECTRTSIHGQYFIRGLTNYGIWLAKDSASKQFYVPWDFITELHLVGDRPYSPREKGDTGVVLDRALNRL